MANTVISTSDAIAMKLWSDSLYRESIIQPFFSKYMGNSSSIIQLRTDFESMNGDRIRFAIRKKLVGEGVHEGETLEGKEEALRSSTFDLTLGLTRKAVKFDTSLSVQRAQFSIPEEAQLSIKDWAIEEIDNQCFNALYTAPTNVLYSGIATNDAGVSAKLTMAQISKAKAVALTGNFRQFNPLKPVKVMGKDYFVLLVHPSAIFDLKNNDSNFNQAMREAEVRGKENPIFSGSTAIVDGVIVLENERVPFELVGSTIVTKSTLLGQQSLVFAYGEKPKFIEQTKDFGIEKAIAVQMTTAVAKPKFDGVDYGSIQVVSAMSDLSI